ncbi:hypothetical protein [Aquitalea magnusonii]|uniref:Phage protein n=1 Tax=Aquitalea magnusonii TaxID=332411 RepID=A0A318JN08_9NEIS|nr:hypothetical protein [Aquitalea magnusonii]PXX49375.1 hypothetical protein DFR38_10414 [Aquitalea magnusonii]
MLYRNLLRDAIVAAIQQANTLAGLSVWNNRDAPLMLPQLPAVIVSAPSEHKESMGRNVPMFNTIAQIHINARVQAADLGTAVADLDVLVEQIEEAIFASPDITRQIQQFASVDTEVDFSAEQRYHIGEAQIVIALEFPQLYNPNVTTQLTDIGIHTQVTAPGASSPIALDMDSPLPTA